MSDSYVSVPIDIDTKSGEFAATLRRTGNEKLNSSLIDALSKASDIRGNEAALGLRKCEVYCEVDSTGTIKCGVKCQFLM